MDIFNLTICQLFNLYAFLYLYKLMCLYMFDSLWF